MTKLTTKSKDNIELAKKASKECFKEHTLLQELSFCQAILEAGLRNSPPSGLALKYCNLFGMKPGSVIKQGTAGIITMPTKEFVSGKYITVAQSFLSNNDIEDSFKQHEQLLSSLSRYKSLFKCKTFEEVAKAIHKAGYATDNQYPNKLMQIHKKYYFT